MDGTPNESMQVPTPLSNAHSYSLHPCAGTDGTPNESMQDVLVRVRQLMSITETQVRPRGAFGPLALNQSGCPQMVYLQGESPPTSESPQLGSAAGEVCLCKADI